MHVFLVVLIRLRGQVMTKDCHVGLLNYELPTLLDVSIFLCSVICVALKLI